MVDISSQNNKINVTVSSSGNTANTNVTPDYAQYYSEKSKEWAISNRIIDNTDYSSKYYANESKKQADISTAKTTEVIESGNTAVSNIESARDNAITDITNQESLSVDNVNTAGATQVSGVNTAGITQVANVNSEGTTQINLAKEQVTLATNQANIATEQATIATNKTSEVVASGNEALTNIDTAKNNAITSITNQETTSKTSLIDEGATQVGLIQNEGATQVANVQSTGFYMRDDKLYYINSQGEETEFKSGGSGLEICDIGMALYVDETKGLRRYLNGQIVDINTNTQAFLNRLLEIKNTNPELFTTESNWQSEATLNIDGCVYKFVLNYSGDNVVSVRLPKYPYYVEINAGGTLPVVGNGMTLGISQGEAKCGLYYDGTAFDSRVDCYGVPENTRATVGTGIPANYSVGITSDPTKSGIQTTLKQTKLKMRYFIQIATGSETEANITNKFENTNPQTLLENKYSDKPLYNESWLLSNGQWNAKAVYPTAYEALQIEYNTEIETGTTVTLPSGVSYTKRGLSVKLPTDSDITDYDFKLNTAEETFRLPLKTLHTDDTVDSLLLYYYVGETVQNANLIDAGRIGEQLANKQDKCIHIIDTYVNGTSGYRIWSDGYCEQWGICPDGGSGSVRTASQVTMLKTFRDTDYNLQITSLNNYQYDAESNYHYPADAGATKYRTENSFTIIFNYGGRYWKACGYLAEGQY